MNPLDFQHHASLVQASPIHSQGDAVKQGKPDCMNAVAVAAAMKSMLQLFTERPNHKSEICSWEW